MYLCIDTTTSYSSITLIDSSEKGNHLHIPLNPQNASEQILEVIDKLISQANIKLSNLKGIYVIKGPGSFTGLRVGIAVANQFAHQLKIPIVGLKTDEWWRFNTDEKDFVFLQSMNKNEIYISKPACRQARLENIFQIIPIEELSGTKKWLGKLSEDHLSKLPSTFTQITDVLSPEETWAKVVLKAKSSKLTAYDLVEPYYGKEPMITKSKKKLQI